MRVWESYQKNCLKTVVEISFHYPYYESIYLPIAQIGL